MPPVARNRPTPPASTFDGVIPRVSAGGVSTAVPGIASGTLQNLKQSILQNDLIKRTLLAGQQVVLHQRLLVELHDYFITSKDLAKPGVFNYGVSTQFRNPVQDVCRLMDAVLRIQGYRDRVCEIQIELINSRNTLQRSYKAGESVILDMYFTNLQAHGLRTEAAQKAFIASILGPITERLIDAENQKALIEATLVNLDKAHYAYQAIGDWAVKLFSRSEGGYAATRPAGAYHPHRVTQ